MHFPINTRVYTVLRASVFALAQTLKILHIALRMHRFASQTKTEKETNQQQQAQLQCKQFAANSV